MIFELTATGAEIVWQDNTTEPVYNVNSSGAYSAQLTRGACQISDTITIDVLDLPEVVLPDTASACQGSTLQLELWQLM